MDVSIKSWNFKDTRQKISVPLVMSTNLLKKSFKLLKKPEKKIPRPILGQDQPEKNSAKCLFVAARFRVLGRHRSTKTTTAP